MRLSLLALIAVLSALAFTATAYTGSFCADILTTRARLAEAGERPVAAYQDAGLVKVLFGNPDTGLWTLVGVDIDGQACTMRNGKGLVVS